MSRYVTTSRAFRPPGRAAAPRPRVRLLGRLGLWCCVLLAAWTVLVGGSGPRADQMATLMRAGPGVQMPDRGACARSPGGGSALLTSTGMPRQALIKPSVPVMVGGVSERRGGGGPWVLPPVVEPDPGVLVWRVHTPGLMPDRALARDARGRVVRGPPGSHWG